MGGPLNISIFTRDDIAQPSPYIRLVQPLTFLRRGASISVDSGIVNDELIVDAESWKAADIVIVTRGFPNRETIDFIREISASKKHFVYETDDAIPLIPAHHQKSWYREAAPQIFECARLANVVTVSTPPLAQLFRKFNRSVEVIENQLDPRIWKPHLRREKTAGEDRIRVGMVGSKHHEQDFEILRDVVGAIAKKHESVMWIAYGEGAKNLLDVLPADKCQFVPSNYHYESHPERLARLRLDIGLCPLADDDFNRCKSDIKYLEFAFLGVAGIYSRLPPYESSVSHKANGLLCEWSPEDWYDQIQTLINDQALRDQISQRAYSSIQDRFLNYDNNRWNEILAKLV
jgi:glycosyltransferase involved in cell wall biosynthesis